MTPSPAQRERAGVRVVEPLGLVTAHGICKGAFRAGRGHP
jgi:hypothetical protein